MITYIDIHTYIHTFIHIYKHTYTHSQIDAVIIVRYTHNIIIRTHNI